MTQTTWIIAEIFAGITILILLTAFVTRWFGPPGQRDPADILKERYARGEISRVEYQQMANDLGISIHQATDRPPRLDDREISRGSTTGHAL